MMDNELRQIVTREGTLKSEYFENWIRITEEKQGHPTNLSMWLRKIAEFLRKEENDGNGLKEGGRL